MIMLIESHGAPLRRKPPFKAPTLKQIAFSFDKVFKQMCADGMFFCTGCKKTVVPVIVDHAPVCPDCAESGPGLAIKLKGDGP